MQQDLMTVDAERHMPETTDRLEQEKEEDVLQTLVDDNIVEGVSIYDSEFDHGLDMYGDDYIQEYITGVSEHLAENIVRAYAAHDMKRYQEISPYFTEVYRFLFPVSDFEAGKAGNGDTYALVEHDVLDEGIDIIRKHYTLYEYRDDMIPVYDDIRHSDDSPTTAELRENSGWDRVKQGYEIVQEALDLPLAAVFDDFIVGSYARERTLAFKHHTAAKESCDQDSPENAESERKMREYMRRGEIVKFSPISSDYDLLNDLGKLFLNAVEEHDRGIHGPDEWKTNIKTMSLFYGTLLSEAVKDRYDGSAVTDIHDRYRERLSEAVS
jgi:hypothetical protein